MEAIIMAGGEGSRLRPLTCDTPKPMMKLCGKPILEYILDLLLRHNIISSTITVKYLANEIKEHFESGNYKGHKINFVEETAPLGTAGSVKNALSGQNRTFIVMSGDAMCDFDLSQAIKFHNSRKAAVTILTTRIRDPREYGLVCPDESGRVTGFVEKPGWGQSVCNIANTGIYIIEPECMELVPDDKEYDFAKDLFPTLLKNGMPIYSYECDGYWCDIGNIEAYLKCQRDMLNNKIKCDMPAAISTGVFLSATLPKGDYTLVPPVYIGNNVNIASGAVIGPETAIGDNCTVMQNAKIRYSVLGEETKVGKDSSFTGAITSKNVRVKSEVSIFENSVVGSNSVIGNYCTVYPDVLIWPQKTVSDNCTVRSNLKYGQHKKEVFNDRGMEGELGIELTPESVARLGCAIGSSCFGGRIGIAGCDSAVSQMLKFSITSGFMSAGSQIWDFGECFISQFRFLTAFCGLSTGVYVCDRDRDMIRIFGEYGLSMPRYAEREIESNFIKGEFKNCTTDEYKKVYDMKSMQYAYERALLNSANGRLDGINVKIKCQNESIRDLMNQSIEKLSGKTNGKTVFRITPDGTSVTAQCEEYGKISFEQLLTICCNNEMKNGKNVVLPFDSPGVIEKLAIRHEKRVLKYLNCPADRCDLGIRKESVNQQWVSDGLLMTMKILGIMKTTGKEISELVKEIPEFAVFKKVFALKNLEPCKLSEIFEASGNLPLTDEGIVITNSGGRTIITPDRIGKHIRVITEATSMEAARELCSKVNLKLKNASLDIPQNLE